MLKTFALRERQCLWSSMGRPGSPTCSRRCAASGKLTYDLTLAELRPGDTLDRGDHRIQAFEVEHGVNANGYALPRPSGRVASTSRRRARWACRRPVFGRLQAGEAVTGADGREVQPQQVLGPPRPGRKVVIAGDTRPARVVLEAAQGADLLVHEATFAAEEQERADETLHATAADVAQLARAAEVRMLALTHLSNRYFGPEIAREARAVFPETVVPRDFDIIDVRFPERRAAPRKRRGARGHTRRANCMAGMVQVAVARDLTEAEEIQTILRSAGIPSELHLAVEQHPTALADGPEGARGRRIARSGSARDRGDDRPRRAHRRPLANRPHPTSGRWRAPTTASGPSTTTGSFSRSSSRRASRGRRVLDVGCGTGRLAVALAEGGARVWGIDPSEEMLAQARAHDGGRRAQASLGRGASIQGRLVRGRGLPLGRPPARQAARLRRDTARSRAGRASRARHFRPESLDRFWISKVFPAIVEIDRARFPTEAQLAGELADAGFETVRTRRLTQTGRLDRGEALERIRGRYISTLQLLGDEELAEGLARRSASFGEVVEDAREWLVVAAERP